ncbi:MAG: acyl-CoA dehydrogenase family protein [Gemmataceae bacterium]|nr:acyl-CoA dehydrogenase family protein [Gemmataceae bacterium]
MALSAAQIAQQKKQAEELLFSGPEHLGFAKRLFFGHFRADQMMPYPVLTPAEQKVTDEAVAKTREFCRTKIDAAEIDRIADIPKSVVQGLADIGVLGMTGPTDSNGLGFNQQQYCKVLEVLGGHCSSTAVFVNAHGSIGIRALMLFGTPEQKKTWLPGLCKGEKLGAFALTEEKAGSDAGNVQTKAEPCEGGWILNGTKRYITNGAIADVLTVMARTPDPKGGESKVTAFLVTPDMPGFKVVEPRAPKCGIRGTATAWLAFENMKVPAANILGPIGKGLRVALTVLDFGRTTFGATCTGAAKTCIQAATKHAKSRVQFQQTLSEFELVKKKIGFMAAHAFAMEAMTTVCAKLIDSGAEDYMLETAMLKVFATEHLWTIVNDTIQIFGGQGYFSNEPYERMMRDARINTIGEGANDVLKAFIAVVGCRAPGMQLDAARKNPLKHRSKLFQVTWEQTGGRYGSTDVPVQSKDLKPAATALGKRIKQLGLALPWVFLKAGTEERFIQAQLVHERLADIALDLYAASCTLSRLDSLMTHGNGDPRQTQAEISAGRYFLKIADRRIGANFAALKDNDDQFNLAAADAALSVN